MSKITIGIVDDHHLFSKSLSLLLKSFADFEVQLEASNGSDLQEKIKVAPTKPDIMLIDVAMPIMDGIQTAKWLRETYPAIKCVALSMNDKESVIIDMLKSGCCAYLFKDTHPDELERALKDVYTKGYYNSDASILGFRKLIMASENPEELVFTDKEIEFLGLACSDLTYKEIAKLMSVSERTVDGYREGLFQKFRVQSRTGMALEGLRRGLIKL
jgi:DNA-binding NarL/FixJ family response regulator